MEERPHVVRVDHVCVSADDIRASPARSEIHIFHVDRHRTLSSSVMLHNRVSVISSSSQLCTLTVHQLLLLQLDTEILLLPHKMQRQNMKPCASIVTFHSQGSMLMLHCEIITDSS